MRSLTFLGAIAALTTAAGAAAQGTNHPVIVAPRGGYITFPSSSGIKNAPFIGVDAQYRVTPNFLVGATFSTSQPKTNGDDFIAALKYGDTTFLYRVIQPLQIFDTGIMATLQHPMGSLTPYVTGSVGAYKIYFDPQVSTGQGNYSRMFTGIGGGARWAVTSGTAISLQVEDHMYSNFNRAKLNPSASTFANTRFVEDVPTAPATNKSLNNIMLSIGFTFTPFQGGAQGGGEGDK